MSAPLVPLVAEEVGEVFVGAGVVVGRVVCEVCVGATALICHGVGLCPFCHCCRPQARLLSVSPLLLDVGQVLVGAVAVVIGVGLRWCRRRGRLQRRQGRSSLGPHSSLTAEEAGRFFVSDAAVVGHGRSLRWCRHLCWLWGRPLPVTPLSSAVGQVFAGAATVISLGEGLCQHRCRRRLQRRRGRSCLAKYLWSVTAVVISHGKGGGGLHLRYRRAALWIASA